MNALQAHSAASAVHMTLAVSTCSSKGIAHPVSDLTLPHAFETFCNELRMPAFSTGTSHALRAAPGVLGL